MNYKFIKLSKFVKSDENNQMPNNIEELKMDSIE